MDITYNVIIKIDDIEKEFVIPAEKSVMLGTTEGCDLVFPRLREVHDFCLEVKAIKNTFGLRAIKENDTLKATPWETSALPAKFEAVLGGNHGTRHYLEIKAVVSFEKATPVFSYAVELPSNTQISIGAHASSEIRIIGTHLQNCKVSLIRKETKCIVKAIDSTFGLFVNGELVSDQMTVDNFGYLSVDGFDFYFRNGYLYIDKNARVQYPSHWKRIDNILSQSHLQYPKFNKSPRVLVIPSEDPIEVLDPPAKIEPNKTSLIMKLLPTVIMAVPTAMMRMTMSNNTTYAIFGLVTMGAGICMTVISTIHEKKQLLMKNEQRKEQYEAYIARKTAEIEDARKEELQMLREIYRTPQQGTAAIQEFSTRLFDRNPGDVDFLQGYLGYGQQLARRIITHNARETIEPGDALMQIPEELCEKYRYIQDAPIVTDMYHSNAIGIVGENQRLYGMMTNLTIDICTRHSYRDVQLFYIINPEDSASSKWLRWLPHVQNRELGVRNIVCSNESKVRLFEYLYSFMAQREQSKVTTPHVVVMVQRDDQIQSHSLSNYLSKANELGVTFVFFENFAECLPDVCDEIITLDRDMAVGTLVRKSDNGVQWQFAYSMIDTTAQKAALRLAPVYCEEVSLEGSLPPGYSFFDCFGVSSAEELLSKERWGREDITKTLRAPIGIDHRGELVYLDIHEKGDGPHGLVAGTTGSGKSEFLQSYMTALSLRYAPDEVAFLIIDFKGAGMANQLEKLPHLVGRITNIDGREIQRSLRSVRAELQKRQKRFDACKVNQIDKYIQKYKAGEVTEPMPHLVIVVDEFAELKAAQPEFMDELISAARIGRSLGIHLVLATQKPSGQVSDQIWSNSRFRLCFKVQTKEDSNEMLKSPLAAEIREAGRGYLQVGNGERFELFQSAYSGGSAKNEAVSETEDFQLAEVSLWGERNVIYDSARKRKELEELFEAEQGKTEKETQLQATLRVMNEFCSENRIRRLPGICLPALEDKIPYIPETGKRSHAEIVATVGCYDDPDNQLQGDVRFSMTGGNLMIIGSAQSGKTMALQTIIRSLAEKYSSAQVNIYILDFASMVLKNYEGLRHVGGVAVSAEEEKVKNLFKMLLGEMAARKEKLLKSGVSSFSAYLEAGKSDLPQIVLVLDNFTAFRELYENESELLLKICREGTAVGICVIIANMHTTGLGYKFLANFANRMSFYCHDSGEYSSLFDYCRMSPQNIPGRGLVKLDNRILEFQAYQGFEGRREIDQVHAVKTFIEQTNRDNQARAAKKIPVVPDLITRSTLRQENPDLFKKPYQIPIGMNYATMEIETIDLMKVGAFGICGREGMGRTNFLMNILQTLQEDIQIHPAEVYIVDDLQMKLKRTETMDCVKLYSADAGDAASTVEKIYNAIQLRKEMVQKSGLVAAEAVKQLPMLLLVLSGQDAVKAIAGKSAIQDKLMEIIKEQRTYRICVVITGIENVAVSYSGPAVLKYLKDEKKVFMFEDVANFKFFDTTLREEKAFEQAIRTGDAYQYIGGHLSKIRTMKNNDLE